jgi:membrane-bound lytic murein transglycosylase MltF
MPHHAHLLNFGRRHAIALFMLSSAVLTGCSSKPQPSAPVPGQQAASTSTPATLETADADAAQQKTALALPKNFGRFTGDWDQIAKRGFLRALVIYSKSGFYYDKGRPRGFNVEAMDEFEKIINKKLKTRGRKFKVVFVPVPPGQLQQALNDGMGDLICAGVIITPEREKLVDFTLPLATGVKLVVVTSKAGPSVNSIDDLSGKDVDVSSGTVARTELEKLNQSFKQAGKPEIAITPVDSNLTEEDLLEMVNAGLIPATVSANYRAKLWSQVYTNLVVTPAVIKDDGEMAWAMRKGSPQLKAVMDEFVKGHRLGTGFGNMMVNRYVKNVRVLKNSTSQAEMNKFKSYVKYFQQYAAEYNFDYLMLAAQGYQESMLNQNLVSPRGAVGVMQVLPKYAAAQPIDIPNVRDPQDNIHAGTKMLAFITKTYFNDPAIDQMNKTLFTFASYNAGQNRIVRLRKEAQAQGLDPNKWFGNVEIVAANDIGQETVQYVANIYKYYVAYKLTLDQLQVREQAKEHLKAN